MKGSVIKREETDAELGKAFDVAGLMFVVKKIVYSKLKLRYTKDNTQGI